MTPLFTIITATYNAAGTLPRLLESLASQTCRDFEFIMQDGASTDDTVAIAERDCSRLSHFSITSEKDTGIYDAWNKALPRIRGQWVLFLGADDLLAGPDVLDKAKALLLAYDDTVLLAGGFVECFEHLDEPIFTTYYQKQVAFEQRKFRIPFCHTALFARGSLFYANRFDAKYRIAGDYEWILRILQDASQIEVLKLVVARMALGGISSSPLSRTHLEREILSIRLKYFPIYFIKSLPSIVVYNLCNFFKIKQHCKPFMQKNPFLRKIWQFFKKAHKFLTKDAF